MNQELIYLLLIFGLLVVPRALQRLKIPAPITCLLLGVGAMLAWGARTHDPVVTLLSTLGISSLFLFAGLEVEFKALRRGLGRRRFRIGHAAAAAGGPLGLLLGRGLGRPRLRIGLAAVQQRGKSKVRVKTNPNGN